MQTKHSNLDPLIQSKMLSILSAMAFYVDAINGDDTNDGLTEKTPLKTLTKLSSMLNSKFHTYTRIYIKNGIYTDGISIFDSTGNIIFIGESVDGVIIGGMAKAAYNIKVFTNLYLANNATNFTFNNLTFNGSGMSTDDRAKLTSFASIYKTLHVTFNGCKFDGVNVTSSSGTSYPMGINIGNDSNVVTAFSTISNCGFPLYCKNGSIIVSDSTFSNNRVGYYNRGGYINIRNSSGTVTAASGSNLSMNDIEAGSIVEQGAFANGKYYKYGNGKVELHYFKSNAPFTELLDDTGVPIDLTKSVSRFCFNYPFKLKTIESATMNGYVTNDASGFFNGLNVRIGTVALDKIYGFVDHSGNTAHNDKLTRIAPLSFTVTGTWK